MEMSLTYVKRSGKRRRVKIKNMQKKREIGKERRGMQKQVEDELRINKRGKRGICQEHGIHIDRQRENQENTKEQEVEADENKEYKSKAWES